MVLIIDEQTMGRSFVAFKDLKPWWNLADRNTVELQRLTDMKVLAWKEYGCFSPRCYVWRYFNLRGCIWWHNKMYVLMHGRACLLY